MNRSRAGAAHDLCPMVRKYCGQMGPSASKKLTAVLLAKADNPGKLGGIPDCL